MGLKDKATARLDRARRRSRFLDHVIRTWERYRGVRGDVEAGAVTYFAFLSFFPVLALAFFVVGYVARVYPGARDNLVSAIQQVLPGLVGDGPGEISLSSISHNASAIGIIGALGVLYSGLGWVAAMGTALQVVFETPERKRPNFIMSKLRDLVALLLIGVTLIIAVAVSGAVHGLSQQILDWVGLGSSLSWLLVLLGVVIGIGANMVLFFAMFRLLALPAASNRALWSGALVGALGFEILKQLSTILLQSTKSQPAFQAFGIALILLVWINYFSRDVLYAAAWAHTAHAARTRNTPAAPTPDSPSRREFSPESAHSFARVGANLHPSRRELAADPSEDGERLRDRVHSARAMGPGELAQALRDTEPGRRTSSTDKRILVASGVLAGVAGSALMRALLRRSR